MKSQYFKLIFLKSFIMIFVILIKDSQSQTQNNKKTTNLASINITKKDLQSETDYFISFQTGVYADFSNPDQINGQLVLAITSNNDGCSSRYLNKILPKFYVSFVVKNNSPSNKCTFSDLISNAIQNNASALIIKTNADTDSDNFNNNIQFQNNQFVVILVTDIVGQYLETTLKSRLDQSSSSTSINVQISLNKQIENNPTNGNNNSGANMSNRSTDLSATSITFIVLGTMGFVLLISAMWVIFYIIQRSRSIEERQRLEQLIQRLTRRAISKMKYRRIKNGDKELLNNEKCAICLEGFELNQSIRQLPCLHYFHKKEIDTWLYINQTCPVCKINVLKAYGLNINSKSNFFQRALERLHFVNSPIELNEAVLSQMNDERRDTFYTIRSLNSFNNGRSNLEDLNTIDRLYSDFQGSNLKKDGVKYEDIPGSNINNNKNQSSLNKIGRKLAFFGEKLSENDTNHVVFENENENLSDIDNNNRNDSKNKTNSNNNPMKKHQSSKESIQDEKNTSSKWQPNTISISIPKALNPYMSNNSNDESKISIIEDDYNNIEDGLPESTNKNESNNSEILMIDVLKNNTNNSINNNNNNNSTK